MPVVLVLVTGLNDAHNLRDDSLIAPKRRPHFQLVANIQVEHIRRRVT